MTYQTKALPLTAGFADGEDGWGAAMNRNLEILGALANGRVSGAYASAPSNPNLGDAYIRSSDNQIGIRVQDNGAPAWVYIPAVEGMSIYNIDAGQLWLFKNNTWTALAGGGSGSGSGGLLFNATQNGAAVDERVYYGNIIQPLVALTLRQIGGMIDLRTGQTVKAVVYEVSADNVLGAKIGETSTSTAASAAAVGPMLLPLAAPVSLDPSKRYWIAFTAVDKGPSAFNIRMVQSLSANEVVLNALPIRNIATGYTNADVSAGATILTKSGPDWSGGNGNITALYYLASIGN